MKIDDLTLLIVSRDFDTHKQLIADYTALAIQESIQLHPESEFTVKAKQLSGVGKVEVVRILLNQGYDGMLFVDNGQVVIHIYFQKVNDYLHMFNVKVDGHEGQGLATQALVWFVKYAFDDTSVKGVRIGAGGHPAVERIHQKIGKGEVPGQSDILNFPFETRNEGWLDFTDRL